MSVTGFQPSPGQDWKNLYTAALFETQAVRVPSLISAAERAIQHRAQQLSAIAGDHIQEEEAIDDALYALHALRNCLELRARWADAT
jgi:hypothetical protein